MDSWAKLAQDLVRDLEQDPRELEPYAARLAIILNHLRELDIPEQWERGFGGL